MEIKLGENILRLRRNQGLTQEQLARLLNVSVGAVSKWENGNNRPDIELLPIIADVLQVSIDALIGYEKAYKNLEIKLKQIENLLFHEEYVKAEGIALDCLRRYPNDFDLNKILADTYYSQCFSDNMEHMNKKINKSIYFYERCIELFDSKKKAEVTEESLYIQIATLCMWDKTKIQRAVEIIEKYNDSRKYDNLLASCLYFLGDKERAKKLSYIIV
ncbi:MAG: helix-turn-helix domain-containing protein [Roseburia sp.]